MADNQSTTMTREVIECVQGSERWLAARIAIVTASRFANVIGRGKGRKTYMERKVDERRTGEYVEGYQSGPMKNGNKYEPFARKYYEDKFEVNVELVGFIKMGGVGCSPDGLVGKDGIIEIKCSEGPYHERIVKKQRMPTTHIPQVQGVLWIADRKWCDFISYYPWGDPANEEESFYCIRVMRDDIYINEILKPACEKFLQELNDMNEIMRI